MANKYARVFAAGVTSTIVVVSLDSIPEFGTSGVMSISHATGAATVQATLDSTLGAILVGTLVSMVLWGVICMQTYDYFTDNMDGRPQRWTVALLWIIDTFSSAKNAHMVYYYLVTNYTNPTGLGIPPWSMNCHSLVVGVSNFIIRIMFARRIYQFGKKNFILPAWIMSISICTLVIGIIMAVKLLSQKIDSELLHSIKKLLYMSISLSLTADLSITVGLCWLLQLAKPGIQRSDSLVDVLMVYVVTTGLLVTIVATVGMITYLVMPDNQIFFAFFMVLSQLYVNAYLASLNARRRLRGRHLDSGLPLSGSSSHRKDTQSIVLSATEERASHPALAISFQTGIEQKVDDDDNEVKNPPHVV